MSDPIKRLLSEELLKIGSELQERINNIAKDFEDKYPSAAKAIEDWRRNRINDLDRLLADWGEGDKQ